MCISAYESVIDYAIELWYVKDVEYMTSLWLPIICYLIMNIEICYDIWFDTVINMTSTVSMDVSVMTICMPGFHHWVASHITRQHFSDPSE